MRKLFYMFILLVLGLMQTHTMYGQRKMETLDRGLVAVKVSGGVFVGWRILGEEWYDVKYNLYRDGVLVNSEPLEVSNYTDSEGTTGNTYTIAAVVNGVEQSQSMAVVPWSKTYMDVQLDRPSSGTTPVGDSYSYSPNDCSIGDVDGDSTYEIIVKWEPSNAHDNSHSGYTGNVYIDAYELDGERLWRIDLGRNIRAGAHYTQFMVYDLDGDGIAEVACKTAPGTKDASDAYLSTGPAASDDDSQDYRNTSGYILDGPEYLTVFNGETGHEMQTVLYVPDRYPTNGWGKSDDNHNRVDRFLACVAYLDGKNPSLVMCRGYYGRTVLAAWDWDGATLDSRWLFDSNTPGNGAYAGQGNHNLSVTDADGDGRDEIIFGSCTFDDDGTGLYSTYLGHGDAMHVGDLDPYRKGKEVFRCLEASPQFGTVYHAAADGQVIIHNPIGKDCGRCCAGNISDDYLGVEMFGGYKMYSSTTTDDITSSGLLWSENFRIYWDGDLLEELLNHENYIGTITKPSSYSPIFTATGGYTCNGSKATPCIQADIFGDWREELIYRTSDDSKIRIFTTTDPTIYRNYTLMHDLQYRLAIAWQNVGYNQPPHVSYFLGERENMTVPPPPIITNGRLVYNGSGTWDTSSSTWINDTEESVVYSDGEHVLFDVLNGEDVTVSLSETVSPSHMTVNTPGNDSLKVSGGKLSGTMNMVKQGMGSFTFNGEHDYSGKTEVWTGRLNLNGNITNSPVWLNLFGEFGINGEVSKGIVMRYGSELYVGGKDSSGVLTVGDSLQIEESGIVEFDLYAPSNENNDSIIINGKLKFDDGTVLKITPHLEEGVTALPVGDYVLATVSGEISGNVDKLKIEGLLGIAKEVKIDADKLVLTIKEMRAAATVTWNGDNSNEWDLVKTLNFLNNGGSDVFVTGDDVIMTDNAVSKDIVISDNVVPSSVVINNTESYTMSGDGSISGTATLTKEGTGKLTISNNNDFTGKVSVNGGTLEVATLPNNLSDESPIGPVSNSTGLFNINGGKLRITGGADCDRALYVGANGATIENSAAVNWNSPIAGGSLIKTGSGELVFAASNTINELTINSGSVRLYNWEASPGSKVIFNGGTLYSYNNTGGNADNINTNFHVAEGQTGKLYLDGRANYNGTLTGGGIFNMYVPFVRTYLRGNYSNFTGTIKFIYNKSGSYEPTIDVANTYGYENARVEVGDGLLLIDDNKQTVKIGTLLGTGAVTGALTWELGGRNENFTLQTAINSGNISKVGTGIMTISSEKSYSGSTTVNEGTLIVANRSGSATGTGNVYINSGGILGGSGIISGTVYVKDGGTLYAGFPNEYSGSSINAKSVLMYTGGIYFVKLNPKYSLVDKAEITQSFSANGQLVMNNLSSEPYKAGQSFQIVSAASINGSFRSISPATPGEGLEWDLTDFNSTGTIKVAESTGINDFYSNATELNVYPNPSDGFVYLNVARGLGEATVQVETLNGALLSSSVHSEISQLRVDLSGYNAGIYVVKAIFDDQIMSGKVVLK